MGRRTRLFRLDQTETSGVDLPANHTQVGGAGWMVLKADGTPVGSRPDEAPSKTVKEATVPEPSEELKAQLAKAAADLEAANGRIAELEKAAEARKAAEAAQADTRSDFEKAMAEMPAPVAEAFRKSQADAAEAMAKAAKLEDEAANASYIAKAAGYTHLPAEATKLGPVLRSVYEKAGAETGAEVERLLKAAEEIAEKSDLFKAVGSGAGGAATNDAWAQIMAKAAELRTGQPALTQEQAIDKACQLYPDLRAAYQKSMRGGR